MATKKLTNEEVKAVAFEILKYIKKVCEENNIRYTLTAGTLLGAVRHQGFIPWDDDIDITLPWEDYLKLIEILRTDDKYQLFYDMDMADYPYCFAKLSDPRTIVYEPNRPRDGMLGVWVDIFPMLPYPTTMTRKEYLDLLDKANEDVFGSIKFNYCFSESVWKRVAKAVIRFPRFVKYKIKGTDYWKQKRSRLFTMQATETATELGSVPSVYGEVAVWPKEMFDSYTTVVFEGVEFSAVENWECILRSLYGDYMQLPPVEKRVGGHFEAYYRECYDLK